MLSQTLLCLHYIGTLILNLKMLKFRNFVGLSKVLYISNDISRSITRHGIFQVLTGIPFFKPSLGPFFCLLFIYNKGVFPNNMIFSFFSWGNPMSGHHTNTGGGKLPRLPRCFFLRRMRFTLKS